MHPEGLRFDPAWLHHTSPSATRGTPHSGFDACQVGYFPVHSGEVVPSEARSWVVTSVVSVLTEAESFSVSFKTELTDKLLA